MLKTGSQEKRGREPEIHGLVQGKGARRYGSRSWEVREKREVREPELGGAGEEREVEEPRRYPLLTGLDGLK